MLPLITGLGPVVRTLAMTTAAYCLEHPDLADGKDALAGLLADTAAVSPDPRERAAIARLLGILGHRPEALLRDEHPGVRACAALAPEFSGGERATRELVSALEAPRAQPAASGSGLHTWTWQAYRRWIAKPKSVPQPSS